MRRPRRILVLAVVRIDRRLATVAGGRGREPAPIRPSLGARSASQVTNLTPLCRLVLVVIWPLALPVASAAVSSRRSAARPRQRTCSRHRR